MSFKHSIIASTVMIVTAVFLYFISHHEDIHPNKPFSGFPKQIGEWTGIEAHFDKEIEAVLGVDDYFLGNFYNPQGIQIQVYVGFYQSQREGDLIHSPKNCMPGSGWNIIETSHENLILKDMPQQQVKVIKLILKKSHQKQVMLYWFQSRGRIIASEYMQKLYLVYDSITKRRTDGSFVRLIVPVNDAQEKKRLDALKEFSQALIPILYEYIPK